MRRNGKKVALIVCILLIIIIIGVIVTGIILLKNSTIAITKEQKIVKGIKEISKNIEQNIESNKVEQNIDNLFRNTTTITSNTNEFEMKYFDGYTYIVDEIKNMINQFQIQNIIETDLDNNQLNQRLSLKSGKVIESLSQEINCNEDEIAIRLEELNDKYLILNNQILPKEVLLEIFQQFKKTKERTNISEFKFNDNEKKYFIENYKDIILNYIELDMIKENNKKIYINQKEIKCSEISVNLNKMQIIDIMTQLIQKLKIDDDGRNIIISKMKKFDIEYSDSDLSNSLNELENMLKNIDDSINLKINIYCDFIKTYGFSIEIELNSKNTTIINLFDQESNNIEIKNEKIELNAILKNGNIQINAKLENNIIISYNEINKIGVGEINFINSEDGSNQKILINTNFSNMHDITIKLRVQYQDLNNNIDITFNINNVIENINKISEKEINNNSININFATNEEKSEYIETIFNNIDKLIKNAADNSKLIKIYYNYYFNTVSESLNNTKEILKKIFNIENESESEFE